MNKLATTTKQTKNDIERKNIDPKTKNKNVQKENGQKTLANQKNTVIEKKNIDKKNILGGQTNLNITNLMIEKLDKELQSLNLK